MLTFSRREHIHLSSPRLERSHTATHTKQDQLGHVSEIKANTTTVWPSIFADFEPNDVRLVGKAPCLHDAQTLHQQSVWNPQIQMGARRGEISDRQVHYLLQFHRRVAQEATVLRRYFT